MNFQLKKEKVVTIRKVVRSGGSVRSGRRTHPVKGPPLQYIEHFHVVSEDNRIYVVNQSTQFITPTHLYNTDTLTNLNDQFVDSVLQMGTV